MQRRFGFVVALVPAALAACVFSTMRVDEMPLPPRSAYDVVTPVKAHLSDGAVIVYRRGVRVTSDSLIGAGWMFSLSRRDSLPVTRHTLAGVVALESFRTDINEAATAIGVLGGTALAVLGTAALAVAIFGSCPTVYADAGSGLVLQAESFSSAIAPLFEARDTDRLAVRTDAEGRFTIEIRNEALETHYINHLQMLEVRHAADETVVPDAFGRPLAVRGLVAPRVRDRRGRDRTRDLAAVDARVFASDRDLVDSAVTGELEDALELAVARPSGDSVAVVLRLRNSLLNTVFLYDVLMAGRGPGALDWLGRDLDRIADATHTGAFFAGRMGMRIAVFEAGEWRAVGRIADAGPIAWKDIAVLVPVPAEGDSLRVRLTFVADNWRIDRAAVATEVRRVTPRRLAPLALSGPDARTDSVALAAVLAADGKYLQTSPGDRFTVAWDAGPIAADSARTFLLAAQGYYVEWMRTAWLGRDRTTPDGPPDDALLRRALAAWRVQQADYERRFDRSRIPVR